MGVRMRRSALSEAGEGVGSGKDGRMEEWKRGRQKMDDKREAKGGMDSHKAEQRRSFGHHQGSTKQVTDSK